MVENSASNIPTKCNSLCDQFEDAWKRVSLHPQTDRKVNYILLVCWRQNLSSVCRAISSRYRARWLAFGYHLEVEVASRLIAPIQWRSATLQWLS